MTAIPAPQASPAAQDPSAEASADLGLGLADVSAGAVRAAGALPWRLRKGKLEVALVHRPRYDDWAWAKGKLETAESWPGAATREVAEETGLTVRLGIPLPGAAYHVDAPGGRYRKVVRYWSASVVAANGRLQPDVDDMRWLPIGSAGRTLSYRRDRVQLRALRDAAQAGALDTWPLLVVRHAKATPRREWSGKDWLRPLDERGHTQAIGIAEVLAAYRVERLVSSSATRCLQTVEPFSEQYGVRLRQVRWLSEEGFEDDPSRALGYVKDVLRRGRPTVICTHGPLIQDVLTALKRKLVAGPKRARPQGAQLLRRDTMTKGEVLVAHVSGRAGKARIVAVEQHLPLV